MTAGAATGPPLHHVAVGRRSVAVALPSRRDPRLKLSVVIVSLQVLGQTVLEFKVSIAQILVTVAAAALIDSAVAWRRDRVLAWPASALLTGNSIAFILRTSGTRHGDWWSLNGVEFFLGAVVLALLSKYLVRVGSRHVFNPSNVALVAVLLVAGPANVFPQYLWWGPLEAPVLAALAVIALGAVWVLRAVRMVPMALAFLVPFAALVGVAAAAGGSFLAVWHDGPVTGAAYWAAIITSPELLVFVFFMMSDPRTAARGARARLVFGAATAAIAAALLSLQVTEYGVKVAILAALTVSCALVPLVEPGGRRGRLRRARGALARPAVLAAAIIAVAAPVDTVALRGDEQIALLEQGLTGRSPQ